MAHNGDIQIIIFIILWLEHIIGDGVHIKTQKPNYFTNCCTGRVNKKLSGLMSRSANSPQTTILVWSQRRHQRWKLTYIVDSENFSPSTGLSLAPPHPRGLFQLDTHHQLTCWGCEGSPGRLPPSDSFSSDRSSVPCANRQFPIELRAPWRASSPFSGHGELTPATNTAAAAARGRTLLTLV